MEKEKVFIFALSTIIAIAALGLASTTGIPLFPSIYAKIAEFSSQYAKFGAVVAVLIVTASIDGLAGLLFPSGVQMTVDKKKIPFAIVLIVLGIGFYTLSTTFSIWQRDFVADGIITKPSNDIMQRHDKETETYEKGLSPFNEAVEIAKAELSEAEAVKNYSHLAAHNDPRTRKQLLAYIKTGKQNWASKTLTRRVRAIDKAKASDRKTKKEARKRLTKAQEDRKEYINTASAVMQTNKAKFQSEHDKATEQYYSRLNTAADNIYLLDIILGLVIVIGTVIKILFAKAYNIEMPKQRSLGFALYRAFIALQNRIVWVIEGITRIDINHDGHIGNTKKKTNTIPPHTNLPVGASPVKNTQTNLDDLSKYRQIQSELDSMKAQLRQNTDKKNNDLDKAEAGLNESKKELAARDLDKKPTPKKESKKNSGLDKTKKVTNVDTTGAKDWKRSKLKIEQVKGYSDLRDSSKLKLSKYAKELLSKQDIAKARKDCLSSRSNSLKPVETKNRSQKQIESSKGTKKALRVKFLWLAEVLKANGYHVEEIGKQLICKKI